MWTYILRRLLLMIPTLFGVTVVSFVIMQLAPGDPMLAQLDAGGSAGQSTQTREAYLVQKRDLKLDKPILLNVNGFRDYTAAVAAAAHYLALDPAQVARELDELARVAQGAGLPAAEAASGGAADEKPADEKPADEKTPDEKTADEKKSPAGQPEARLRLDRQRLAFLRSLDITDFADRLKRPQQHAALAVAVLAYVRVYCEETGNHGVPAAVAILRSPADLHEKIGAIRALEHMVPDPFQYIFSRTPLAAETPQVETTWRLWWSRNRNKFPPLDPDRKAVLSEQLDSLVAEPSRERLFERLEEFDRDDTPFFVDVLLGDTSLREKSIAAMFLLLYNSKPLEVDVPLDAPPEAVERVAENWLAHYEQHLADYQPALARRLYNVVGDTQYAHMLWRLTTFNFGRSALKTREPVSEKIWKGVVVSAPLMVMAEVFIYFTAVPLGIVCAVNRRNWLDRLISLGLFLLYSIPPFVAGMLFLLFLCYGDYLKIFPMERLHSEGADALSGGSYLADYLWHAVLPVTCLALFSLAGLAMYARSAMLDVLHQDYVRTARAKGLSQFKVIFKHVLRNGLIPIITLFSGFLPALLGGSVIVEVLFNIPGMGRLSFSSIEQKDFPTLMALIYIEAIVVMLSILLTDVLYVLVDPRISFESQGSAK